MEIEEIIKEQKEFLVAEFGKNLFNSDERDDTPLGYRRLARKYWPEYFDQTSLTAKGLPKILKGYEIHHIDFNHSNNVISNLVVLTQSEHQLVHYIFDPKYEERAQILRENYYDNEDYKMMCSERQTKYWNNEENRNDYSKKMKAYYSDENNKRRFNEIMEEARKRRTAESIENQSIKMSNKMKEYWSNEENRKKASERMKECWRKKPGESTN